MIENTFVKLNSPVHQLLLTLQWDHIIRDPKMILGDVQSLLSWLLESLCDRLRDSLDIMTKSRILEKKKELRKCPLQVCRSYGNWRRLSRRTWRSSRSMISHNYYKKTSIWTNRDAFNLFWFFRWLGRVTHNYTRRIFCLCGLISAVFEIVYTTKLIFLLSNIKILYTK